MTPWVLRIIIANLVLFVLCMYAPLLQSALTLVPALIFVRPWTIVTYMFLHAGFGHILFNMLSLFFFGPRLELEMGSRNFLILYFASGIAGALLSFVFSPYSAIVGASGAIYGVMLGFAFFWPKEPIYIWGVIPVQARILVLVMTGLSLIGGAGETGVVPGGGGGVAHFAHLGGFLGGFIALKLLGKRPANIVAAPRTSISAPSAADLKRWQEIDRTRLHEVNREEYDRIMEKLGSLGPGHLTENDRTFLDRFSAT
jgi:membrane associated rhomboid family serine protease